MNDGLCFTYKLTKRIKLKGGKVTRDKPYKYMIDLNDNSHSFIRRIDEETLHGWPEQILVVSYKYKNVNDFNTPNVPLVQITMLLKFEDIDSFKDYLERNIDARMAKAIRYGVFIVLQPGIEVKGRGDKFCYGKDSVYLKERMCPKNVRWGYLICTTMPCRKTRVESFQMDTPDGLMRFV